MSDFPRISPLVCVFLVFGLTACDSGGGMDSEPDSDPEPGEVEATVEGSVTDTESGDPISGADVSVLRVDADEQLGQATTGDEGSYELSFTVPENDTPDQLAIEVEAEGFMAKTDTVGFDQSLSRDIALDTFETTESTASGTVTRADTDDPIEGATVTGSAGDNDLFEVSTDENGQYEATFEVRATDEPDQITVEADDGDFNATEQRVDFTSEITADLSLDPSQVSVVVDGTVLAEQDESSVEGADVSVFHPSGDDPLASTTSVSEGAYELSFSTLAPDAPDSLRLEAEEPRFADTSLTAGFSETISQDIELPSISISTVEELQAIQTDSDFPINGFYKQTADIDASETASWNGGKGFEPIGDETVPFSGSFDGNGFTIEGLSIDRFTEIGLFGYVAADGPLLDVSLNNVTVKGGSRAGGLVGVNSADIENSVVSGTVGSGDGGSVGGLVGRNDGGDIYDSESEATVTARNHAGGLVGRNNDGDIRNSNATGDVSGRNSNIGGLVGNNDNGDIINSDASGAVDGGGGMDGGLVGTNNGTIQNSTASGEVVGGDRLGGIAGTSGGEIRDSKATGVVRSVKGQGRFVGGLVGDDVGDIYDSEADLNVVGRFMVGGLVGKKRAGNIQSSIASGDVESDSHAGGLVGRNDGMVKESEAHGDVDASRIAGGLVGDNRSSIEQSLANGSVAAGETGGGLIGQNSGGAIRSSYSMGSVDGGSDVGGLAGANTDEALIVECYAVGPVSGDQNVGGFIGANGAEVNRSFWDTQTTEQDEGTGRGVSDGTTSLTTDEMQGGNAEENMDGFDFEETWQVVTGDYPALSWEDI